MAMAKYERQFNQHFYQDHSLDKPTSEDEYKIMNFISHSGPYNDESLPCCRAKNSGRKLNFVLKLHQILENSGRDETHDMAISWKIHEFFSNKYLKNWKKNIIKMSSFPFF